MIFDGPPTFGGLRVIVDRRRWQRRTWRERFFTRPWRPWQGMKQVGPLLGPNQAYRIGNTLVMGEAAYDQLRKASDLADPVPKRLSRIAQLDQRTALADQCLHSAEADVRA
jgi:hypothetical protein